MLVTHYGCWLFLSEKRQRTTFSWRAPYLSHVTINKGSNGSFDLISTPTYPINQHANNGVRILPICYSNRVILEGTVHAIDPALETRFKDWIWSSLLKRLSFRRGWRDQSRKWWRGAEPLDSHRRH